MKKLLKKNHDERNKDRMPILLTLICLAPFGHLIFNIFNNEPKHILLKSAFLSFLFTILTTLFWIDYFINKKNRVEATEDYEVTNNEKKK